MESYGKYLINKTSDLVLKSPHWRNKNVKTGKRKRQILRTLFSICVHMLFDNARVRVPK